MRLLAQPPNQVTSPRLRECCTCRNAPRTDHAEKLGIRAWYPDMMEGRGGEEDVMRRDDDVYYSLCSIQDSSSSNCITKTEKAESEAQRGKPKGTLESESRNAIE